MLFVTLAAVLAASATTSQTPPALEGWKLIWGDEFTRAGLPDPKKWDYEVGKMRNQELQYYTRARKENARVEKGVLVIEGRKEAHEGSDYTAASVISKGKFAFQYGRVEVRAKLPSGSGAWPAIWMMGEDIDQVGWPRCGEIDIMEHVAFSRGEIYGTAHGIDLEKGHWSSGGSLKVPDCCDAFHVYAIEWSPKAIDWYVDDKKYFTLPYSGPQKWTYDRRMYLLINLAIGGTWGGAQGVDPAAYPQRYEIDYVRVYQRAKP